MRKQMNSESRKVMFSKCKRATSFSRMLLTLNNIDSLRYFLLVKMTANVTPSRQVLPTEMPENDKLLIDASMVVKRLRPLSYMGIITMDDRTQLAQRQIRIN